MNYKATTTWMFSRLPMYQQQGAIAYKEDLSRTELLASHLGHPENKFKSVHIGGTNGKGSTAHMLAAVLQEAGYKVGLYTSPHLKDFRERIRIDGKKIPEATVVEFIEENKRFLEHRQLSFFEMTVGLAFDYFAKSKVDIAIIEVGLGGRLDSTNIINPELSVITNIGLDHTQFLGDTLQKIATEKAGIIKSHTPVVIGETQSELKAIFIDKSRSLKADISFADKEINQAFPCSLLGDYQKKNIKTVLQSLAVLKTKGFAVSESHIKKGLENVQKLTGLRGRWELLSETPKTICDTAHNREGLTLVFNQLNKEPFASLHIVIGMVNDKNLEKLLDIFPKQAQYYFCKPDIPRGMDAELLAQKFYDKGINGKDYGSVTLAFEAAKKQASNDDIIFVGGSTFVVAEVL
jgi:dihydrofolate synthase/folylpolyglutamate synthase